MDKRVLDILEREWKFYRDLEREWRMRKGRERRPSKEVKADLEKARAENMERIERILFRERHFYKWHPHFNSVASAENSFTTGGVASQDTIEVSKALDILFSHRNTLKDVGRKKVRIYK